MLLKSQSIARGAFVLGAASFLSYLLGLFRDRLLASTFGAGNALDAYNTAFIIPDFIANLLFAGVSLSVLMPVLADIAVRKQPAEAIRVANTVLNLAMLTLIVLSVIAFVLMPVLIGAVAPGFSEEKRSLAVALSRLLLLSPILFAISNTFGSILVSMKRFVGYAFSPVFYNLGIVAGIFLFANTFGVYGVVLGTLGGALLHLLVRFIELTRTPYRYAPVLDIRHPALPRIGRLMVPRMGSLIAVQANLWAWNAIASTIAAGSIVIFNLSRNLQSLPVSLFGIALATAVSPSLTDAASTGDWPAFLSHMRRTFSRITFFVFPASVGMFLLRNEIAGTIFGAGQFTDADVQLTAFTLGVFCLVTPLESIVHLLVRAFYAQLDTKTPLIVAVITTVVSIAGALAFAPWIGVAGLPLGFAAANLLQVALLAVLLRTRVRTWHGVVFNRHVATAALATLVMTIVLAALLWWMRGALTDGTIANLISIASAVAVGGFVYLVVSLALKNENTSVVRTFFQRGNSKT